MRALEVELACWKQARKFEQLAFENNYWKPVLFAKYNNLVEEWVARAIEAKNGHVNPLTVKALGL